MKRQKQLILENLIYLIIWLIVFVVPVFGIQEDGKTDWPQVIIYWKRVVPFLILFLINNYLLIPYFLLRKKSWSYLLFACAVLLILITMQRFTMQKKNYAPQRPPMQAPHNRIHRSDSLPGIVYSPDSQGEEIIPEKRSHPPHLKDNNFIPPKKRPPGVFVPMRMFPVISNCILAVLIIGVNIAIRLLFKSIRDDRQIKELESHTLQAELNYLKAQINPHFFMNTLNNIHALIDIDTEKAKKTVIELSKIMRYVLYDADQPKVLLAKEILFLKNYIELMRIRFTENIDIQTIYPDHIGNEKIPPLLLITLIENAFKHGVGSGKESYVHTILLIEDNKLHYTVENSMALKTNDPSGIGMENLRKRLSLLFGSNYSLIINQNRDIYKVKLILPLEI